MCGWWFWRRSAMRSSSDPLFKHKYNYTSRYFSPHHQSRQIYKFTDHSEIPQTWKQAKLSTYRYLYRMYSRTKRPSYLKGLALFRSYRHKNWTPPEWFANGSSEAPASQPASNANSEHVWHSDWGRGVVGRRFHSHRILHTDNDKRLDKVSKKLAKRMRRMQKDAEKMSNSTRVYVDEYPVSQSMEETIRNARAWSDQQLERSTNLMNHMFDQFKGIQNSPPRNSEEVEELRNKIYNDVNKIFNDSPHPSSSQPVNDSTSKPMVEKADSEPPKDDDYEIDLITLRRKPKSSSQKQEVEKKALDNESSTSGEAQTQHSSPDSSNNSIQVPPAPPSPSSVNAIDPLAPSESDTGSLSATIVADPETNNIVSSSHIVNSKSSPITDQSEPIIIPPKPDNAASSKAEPDLLSDLDKHKALSALEVELNEALERVKNMQDKIARSAEIPKFSYPQEVHSANLSDASSNLFGNTHYRNSEKDLDRLLSFMSDDAILQGASASKSDTRSASRSSPKISRSAAVNAGDSIRRAELDELTPDAIRKRYEKPSVTSVKDAVSEQVPADKETTSAKPDGPSSSSPPSPSSSLDASESKAHTSSERSTASRIESLTDQDVLNEDVIKDLDSTLGFVRNDRIRYDNERFRQENAYAYSLETLRPGTPRTFESGNFFTPVHIDRFYSPPATSHSDLAKEYIILTPAQKTINTSSRPIKNEAAGQDLFTTLSNLERPERYIKSIMKLEKQGWNIIGGGGSGGLVVFEREFNKKKRTSWYIFKVTAGLAGGVVLVLVGLLAAVEVPDTKASLKVKRPEL